MESFAHQKTENIPKLEKGNGGWEDRARKITYSTAFVLSALAAETASAAEIPANASLNDGISILEQGAETEGFETAAAYITLPDGTSFWFSNEGEERRVNLFEAYSGENSEQIASFLREIIQENEIEPGQFLDIAHYHNHPMQSLFPRYSGEPFSIPPSGQGFLSGGDTGFYKQAFFDAAIMQIQEQTGVEVSYEKKVVDALGVWSWTQVDDNLLANNLVYQDRLALDNLYERDSGVWDQEAIQDRALRRELLARLDTAGAEFTVHYNNWLDYAHEGNYSYLAELIDAYRLVGIEMSFEPFSQSD